MAVPSSGPLKLWDNIWNQEIGGTQGNNSLHSASLYAGFSTPDAMSDFYGWSDVEVPSVSTQGFTSVTTNSMTANGNVSATGNENPTRGFYFGTNSSAAGNNTKYSVGVGGTGAFSRSMTGLNFATTYYGWSFACNSAGEAQGSRTQTATQAPPFTPTFSNQGQTYVQTYMIYPGGSSTAISFGYLNPYTGGQTGQCYCACTRSGGSAGVHTQMQTPNACWATNTKSYRWGQSNMYPSGDSWIAHTHNAPSGFNSVSGPGNTSGSGFTSQTFGNNYRDTYSMCFNSDIRLKTNINYL